MSPTTLAADPSPLTPPSIRPPTGPLPIWRFLPTFLRNPLRTLPASVYREPIVVPPHMHGRVAWITEPSLIERVLLDEHEQFPKSPIEQRIFARILGESILTAEGQSWRWQRRIVAPLFRHGDLLALVPRMSEAADRMCRHWQQQGAGKRDIDRDMTDLTFDVLQSTIFNGATAGEAHILKHEIGRYLGWTSWDIAYEILGFSMTTWHPRKRAMQRSADALLDTINQVIARERAAGWPGGGLMARLGQARDPDNGAPMSDGLIAQNLLTFAAAGHETTARALSWTLYLLARAPAWQKKIRDEVQGVAGDAAITAAHVDRLEMTRQVLKEGMRLYPPAPVIGRKTLAPTEIAGHHLPTGAMIVIPIWAVHRHRNLWDMPDTFDPTRFSATNETSHARTQYMPFGFGPRTCIGISFAMIEGIVLLAQMVRAFEFSCAASLAPEPVSRVTLRPRNGMPLTLESVRSSASR